MTTPYVSVSVHYNEHDSVESIEEEVEKKLKMLTPINGKKHFTVVHHDEDDEIFSIEAGFIDYKKKRTYMTGTLIDETHLFGPAVGIDIYYKMINTKKCKEKKLKKKHFSGKYKRIWKELEERMFSQIQTLTR